MNVSERDISILKHIIDYCDQIYMAIERFGDDFTIFPESVKFGSFKKDFGVFPICSHRLTG